LSEEKAKTKLKAIEEFEIEFSTWEKNSFSIKKMIISSDSIIQFFLVLNIIVI
jgi:hypothetical protein